MTRRAIPGLNRSLPVPRTFLCAHAHRPFRSLSTSLPRSNALTRSRNPQPLKMPLNMARDDFAGHTVYSLSLMGRLAKYTAYGFVALGLTSFTAFEMVHFYIEHVAMSAPSRLPDEEDPFGWASEYQGWTGGPSGGTDKRFGWRIRHAIRGAWICQNWGAGLGMSTIVKTDSGVFAPDWKVLNERSPTESGGTRRGDRGYEMAYDYLDLAIRDARGTGMMFPPEIGVRSEGPPAEMRTRDEGDPAVVDLLLLKAGVLERISTPEALDQARGIYARVLRASGDDSSPGAEARLMKLAARAGDVSARLGDGQAAMEWWALGLGRVGMAMPRTAFNELKRQIKQEVKRDARGWLGFRRAATPPADPAASADSVEPELAMIISTHQSTLPPPVLRAAVSLLASTSAHLAQTSHLRAASLLQNTALSLLPPPQHLPPPTVSTAASTLHSLWLQHRSALLTLHHASVTAALGSPALALATSASEQAESFLASIEPLPSAFAPTSSPWQTSAQNLQRDAVLTAAEASYTRGILLERSRDVGTKEMAMECFERAMSLCGQESGAGEEPGEDWKRYSRAFTRVSGIEVGAE